MKTLPLISILMPAKNSEKFLVKTLDSILAQTETDWELIVVNDGSTDRTQEILREYADKDERIKVFQNEEGNGIIPAMRTAFKYSDGTYITRMDSDDLMAVDKLKKMKSLLVFFGANHIVTGQVECFSDDGIKDGYRKYEAWLNGVISSRNIFSEVYRECVIPSSCWMVNRKDLIRVGAFDPDIYPEDYDLCFRFFINGLKPVAAEGILHYWRDHPARVSRNNPEYADQQFFDLKLKYFFEHDKDIDRELVVWGTGAKGKKLVKKIQEQFAANLKWIGNNPKKIGEKIYGIEVWDYKKIKELTDPQIIVAVSSSEDLKEIETFFNINRFVQNIHYYFFC